MDADALIEALGGSAEVAEFLGVAVNTVGNWRQRGVPAWARPSLIRMCEERGVDHRGALDPLPPRRLAKSVA